MSAPERWTEYRAVYRTPASILASPEDRKRGYVVQRTAPYLTREHARSAAMIRAEETHAYVTGYEERRVSATGWELATVVE